MFARGAEVIAKPSKTLEVADTIRERAQPILRTQSGFVDEIVLVSDTEVDHVLTADTMLLLALKCPQHGEVAVHSGTFFPHWRGLAGELRQISQGDQ